MPSAVEEFAPAKVNLALAVTGRRPDGYHLLDTIAVFADVGDTVSGAPAEGLSLSLGGPFAAALLADGSNLVLRAAAALRAVAFGDRAGAPGARLGLDKLLPAASGIGGGSADAAATLRALDRLWGLGFGATRLAEIGLGLGADVPMCLRSVPLRARGVGEDINPLPGFPALDLVLVNPGVAVSTAAVFAGLAGRFSQPLPQPAKLQSPDAALRYLEGTANDLEAPALRLVPVIADALAALRASTGCRFARMSGSGATCFGLFSDSRSAATAASALSAACPGWWVAATKTGAASIPG